jgi:hypothetical protein
LYGWAGVFTIVALWDILAPETLSTYAREHPFLTWIGGGIIMGHLLDVIPEEYDLIDWIGKAIIAVGRNDS